MRRSCFVFLSLVALSFTCRADDDKPLRAGIIGLDTSHAIAFTKIFNDPKAAGDLAAVKVIAVYPSSSADIASSRDRVGEYTEQMKKMGIEIVDSIPALLAKVDVVLIESVDGRPHLEQARAVFAAGKPCYIDKPLGGSLADAIAIDELGKKYNVPWFSSSALRYCSNIGTMRHDEKVGEVIGCDAWSPCHLEPTHPDLYWYGIHGVETLYTIMGPGCASVQRTSTDSAEIVTGTWGDGRVGTFRGIKKGKLDYGAMVFGTKGVVQSGGYHSYKGLVEQIAHFFKTKEAPVPHAETLEIMAFMEAADESKRQGSAPVKLETVVAKAREQAMAKVK
jgi:predicted dehydrogenase